MDCSICLEAITKETGSTTLSCGHAFHFKCIYDWFAKQIIDDAEETCPCCRGKGSNLDRCHAVAVVLDDDDDSDDDDNSSYESEEIDQEEYALYSTIDLIISGALRLERTGTGQWIITDSEDMAYESFRNVFGPMNELDEDEERRNQAAHKIQEFFRKHQDNDIRLAAITLLRLYDQTIVT